MYENSQHKHIDRATRAASKAASEAVLKASKETAAVSIYNDNDGIFNHTENLQRLMYVKHYLNTLVGGDGYINGVGYYITEMGARVALVQHMHKWAKKIVKIDNEVQKIALAFCLDKMLDLFSSLDYYEDEKEQAQIDFATVISKSMDEKFNGDEES